MAGQERHLSRTARKVLRSLHKTHRESNDPGTIYFQVAAIQRDLRLPWERVEDAKLQLAKYRFVSYPPSDVQRDRDRQIMTITAKGIEAAERLRRRKWRIAKWIIVKLVGIAIVSVLAALAAAWLVANHGDLFRFP